MAPAPPGAPPRRIDPFTLHEPWRRFVQEALQARNRFAGRRRRAPSGPLQDRLPRSRRVSTPASRRRWLIAKRGQALVEARRDVDLARVDRQLGELTAGSTGAPAPGGAPRTRPVGASVVASLEAQRAAAERLDAVIARTQSELRVLDARLDEAVARAVELSARAGADAAGIDGSRRRRRRRSSPRWRRCAWPSTRPTRPPAAPSPATCPRRRRMTTAAGAGDPARRTPGGSADAGRRPQPPTEPEQPGPPPPAADAPAGLRHELHYGEANRRAAPASSRPQRERVADRPGRRLGPAPPTAGPTSATEPRRPDRRDACPGRHVRRGPPSRPGVANQPLAPWMTGEHQAIDLDEAAMPSTAWPPVSHRRSSRPAAPRRAGAAAGPRQPGRDAPPPPPDRAVGPAGPPEPAFPPPSRPRRAPRPPAAEPRRAPGVDAGRRRHPAVPVAGLIREIVIGAFLGTSPAADAFKAALRIPNLLQNLLGEGVLSASFIPVYARLRAEGRHEEAGRLAGRHRRAAGRASTGVHQRSSASCSPGR